MSMHFLVASLLAFTGLLSAQSNVTCGATSVPPVIRAEGLAERIADVVYTCTGSPNLPLTGNFTVTLNTEISNRLTAGGLLTGINLTIDSGSGPQAILMQPLLISPNSLVYNGVPIVMSPDGHVEIRIAGIRANATRIPNGSNVIASLALNAASVSGSLSQVPAGTPFKSLFATFLGSLVCAQAGSVLPDDITFTNLIQKRTTFSTVRFTEGFADAFGTKAAPAYLNADSGQRVIMRCSGFPSDARLFVPTVIAGSDAVQPTSGGDFGLPISGGAWAPSNHGSLLLSLVAGAASNGAGGTPSYIPPGSSPNPIAFEAISELMMSNGSAYAVYEVVDSNPSRIETAEVPTFLGLPPDGFRKAQSTNEQITLAPVSTVTTASATEPLPRFVAVTPTTDCSLVGDCSALNPQLTVNPSTLNLTATTAATQQSFLYIRNTGGGAMHWTASVTYGSGSGWLTLQPSSGVNNTTMQFFANPAGLAAGTYTATITVDGGPATTPQMFPITFVVTAGANKPTPAIQSVVNGASFQAVPAVPGSISTITGSNLSGKSVSVKFDGLDSEVLFNNGTQMNVVVPAQLAQSGTSQMTVSVDGISSSASAVKLAAFSPAIFAGAALNQDGSINSISNQAHAGDIVAVFATGLSGTGKISGQIHDTPIDAPYYAGPAPGMDGVQQVNLQIPAGLAGMTTQLSVCGTSADNTKVCSTPIQLSIQ